MELEEHLHLWFDDLQNSESIPGWNNTRYNYKETQHQTLHFSSISILQTLLSSIETSMELNSFPKWWSTIKFSPSHHEPRTSCQGPPTQWQWCHCAPRLISILIIWHLRVSPGGWGLWHWWCNLLHKLMVQDLWPPTNFNIFWSKDLGLGFLSCKFLRYWPKNGWIGTECHESILDVSFPYLCSCGIITNNNDRPALFSNFHTWAVSKIQNELTPHTRHTQTGYFSSIHFHDA